MTVIDLVSAPPSPSRAPAHSPAHSPAQMPSLVAVATSSSRQDSTDGRVRRRQRNTAVVRRTVLEMLDAGDVINAESLSARSGVAVRTIYRHFGGPTGAIDDAVRSHLDAVRASMAEPTDVGPFEERLAQVIEDRLTCVELITPILQAHAALNSEIGDGDDAGARDLETWFGPELEAFDAATRQRTLVLSMLLLRFDSVAYLVESMHADRDAVAALLADQLRRHLTPRS